MPIPDDAAYFEPQEATHFYAAGGAFFLVDPERVVELLGPEVVGSDLLKTLTRKSYPHEAYRQGAIVPALGVEEGHYTVHVRSTATEGAMLPLSHMLFSAGFVLGTETGRLLLANTERLRCWTPGQLPEGGEEHPLTSVERILEIAPGWYSVTVVAGILDSDVPGADEEWVCVFLLDPCAAKPGFNGDLATMLTF